MSRTVLLLLIVTLSASMLAAETPAERVEAVPESLAPTFASMEEMAQAALAAVAAEDLAALRQLAVTEGEFDRVVWPELDVAKLERPMPREFVWRQHEMRHERGLKRAIALFGGQQLALDSIRITGGVRTYGSYRIHRQSQLDIRTADGTTRSIELFASVIEVGGRYKIYSFITD